jgi:hypothetical protein
MKTVPKLAYIDNSLIHGKGLFAQTDIPKDTIIGTLEGKSCKQDGNYVLWLTETEGFEVSCHLKYINHAIKANACAVILAHNHPSGNLEASDADIRITNSVKEGLKLLDIELLDHLILIYEEKYATIDLVN